MHAAANGPAVDPAAVEVQAFWFGTPPSPEPLEQWFRKDAAFDALIGQRFAPLITEALAGGLRQWDRSAIGALARIVVLDQFTRNHFRGSAAAFAGDALALAAARSLVASGGDRQLLPLQRWFAYLPFEHAEDAQAQAESLALFGALAAEHTGMHSALDWAQRHADVIRRFGRYPHRNAVLGRPSTAEELAFLATPGSGF